MTKRWTPVYGTYDCPGRMKLDVDELGITIGTARKALATTEWPGENFRLCIETEESENYRVPKQVAGTILQVLLLQKEALTDSSTNSAKDLQQMEYLKSATEWMVNIVAERGLYIPETLSPPDNQ